MTTAMCFVHREFAPARRGREDLATLRALEGQPRTRPAPSACPSPFHRVQDHSSVSPGPKPSPDHGAWFGKPSSYHSLTADPATLGPPPSTRIGVPAAEVVGTHLCLVLQVWKQPRHRAPPARETGETKQTRRRLCSPECPHRTGTPTARRYVHRVPCAWACTT
jgi:hypothetical protein